MADIGFPLPSKGTLLESLGVIPQDYRGYLSEGLSYLAALKPDAWDVLIAEVRNLAPYASELELGPVRRRLALDSTEALAIVSACRMLLGIVSYRAEDPGEIAAAAIQTGILNAEDERQITSFLEKAARDRATIKQALIASTLQHQVLPSLARVEVRIDVRLEFTAGKVSSAAPVAVAYIDTDTTDTDLWFQMTRTQVEALEARLRQVREQLEHAEEIAKKCVS